MYTNKTLKTNIPTNRNGRGQPHQTSPYSKATRGNIDVTINVV